MHLWWTICFFLHVLSSCFCHRSCCFCALWSLVLLENGHPCPAVILTVSRSGDSMLCSFSVLPYTAQALHCWFEMELKCKVSISAWISSPRNLRLPWWRVLFQILAQMWYSCNVQMAFGSESWCDPSACLWAERLLSPVGSKLGSKTSWN